MGRPTGEELEIALAQAIQLREQGEDTHHMAKALLNLNYRMKFMEDVLDKADLYLHSGEGAKEHADLVRAIERANLAARAAGEEDEDIHPW